MKLENRLYHLLGIKENDRESLKRISKRTKIPVEQLEYYNDNNILPCESDIMKITNVTGLQKIELMLGMGILNSEIILSISKNYKKIISDLHLKEVPTVGYKAGQPVYETNLGKLYTGDCFGVLGSMETESVDLVFADPPFNLDKLYESRINDNLSVQQYISWCERWIDECIRVLKKGGSFFLWNLPKWNAYFSDYLNKRLMFRHWIATDIKYSLPISGRLYPSHYSLLYYVKGEKPNYFNPDRLPMDACRSCYKEVKDYGGYKDKMNPEGINLTDVWYDIPPVRHSKYKKRKGANELSLKLIDRIIEMASQPGDLVFDPFGGSGTTYIAAEIKKRKWIGVELGSTDVIIDRLNNIDEEKEYLLSFRNNYNKLFTDAVKLKRKKLGIWTDDTYKKLRDNNH